MQTISFLKNFGLAGGFLFIAVNGPKEWALERRKNTLDYNFFLKNYYKFANLQLLKLQSLYKV